MEFPADDVVHRRRSHSGKVRRLTRGEDQFQVSQSCRQTLKILGEIQTIGVSPLLDAVRHCNDIRPERFILSLRATREVEGPANGKVIIAGL